MRILFITSTRVGDAILSTGLLSALIAQNPGAKITIACGPAAAQLFAAVPGLEEVLVVRKRGANLHWFALWAATIGHRWDLVVDLRRSSLAWLLNAKARYRQPHAAPSEPRVELVARTLGLMPAPAPRLWTTPEAEREAARLLPAGGPILALGPTANWASKIWPAERFAELTQRLTAPEAALAGATVLVSCGPDEERLARPVIEALPPEQVIYLPGLDLLTLYALYKRAALFIGNDSGLMHLAAAAGIPTLGLFGPTRDDLYAPWGPLGAVVRTQESFSDLTGQVGFDPKRVASLMSSLSVENVETAARALLARNAEVAQ